MKEKLNLGCGNDIRPDYVNLDVADLEGVDVVHDLDQLPLPFDDESFREILCLDVFEHVDHHRRAEGGLGRYVGNDTGDRGHPRIVDVAADEAAVR